MKILEGISHPNIVRVFSANILPVPYVEMEYYPDSLDKLKFPVDIRIAVYIMTQILEGLEFAHHKGIIHCDIKPGNILINDDFIPAVSDWGLGIIEGNRKNAGYSPGYAAPEQIKPEIYGIPDRRCDIYQAGLLFYEMVTGIMPFAAEGPEKSENMIINLIPKPPSEYSAGISEYDSIIMKCLSKDPDRRFETVAELKAALKNVNPQKSDRTIIR
jgi:serine/threonine protein kinase